MKPSLLHLKTLLVAFFRGALVTWKRFTSKFAPGGLIDEATPDEKHLAWMRGLSDAPQIPAGFRRN